MTQKELLSSVLLEIKHIKTHMPNGELKQMVKDMDSLKDNISDLKYTLLNPDDGVVVNTNKNTEYRIEMQSGRKDFTEKMIDVQELKSWRNGVNKALWIIFGILAGVIIRMLIMHSSN
jgi:predicted RNA-binding protein with EMAP domain|tara:strand:- start:1605 stop:1958 length:354 start_codon:yes stop_codon:yes gene_type:complete